MPERYKLSNRHEDSPKSSKSKSKSNGKNSISVLGNPSLPTSFWVVLVVVLLIISNLITYFVTTSMISKRASDTQKELKQLQEEITDLKNDPTNPNSPNYKDPGSVANTVPIDTKNKVQDAVGSSKYQDLASLLSGSVTVVTGGSGSAVQSAQQAIESLNYLNGSSGGWNWNLSAEQLAQLQQGSSAQYFGENAVVGISNNGYVVSIIVNENGQVDTIFMAPTPQDAGITAVSGEGDE